MAKFSFKRPRIISKKFPEMDSTIDGVTKSLNDLVFSYSEKVDKTLQKKHLMMAFSSMVLLLVLGSFISPKGKAESSIFYPETCLGGWINPQYAQGEEETTSNGDESQFNKNNSAVLPKNTNAEMYCGNFKGKFDSATKPTKIIVSLALTKGQDLSLEDTIEGPVFASSSDVILPGASTTEEVLIIASSTATSTIPETGLSTSTYATTSEGGDVGQSATPTPVVTAEEPPSVLNGIIESVKDTVNTLFDDRSKEIPQGTTDTVIVPPPQPEPAPSEPTSYLPSLEEKILTTLFQKVFAEEVAVTESPSVSSEEPKNATTEPVATPVITEVVEAPQDAVADTVSATGSINILTAPLDDAPVFSQTITEISSTSTTGSTTVETATSTEGVATSTLITSSTTIATTTMTEAATTTEENQFQNNFLEVLYTFDGITWISLGELNEISMKYRTFEIPVTATTSWSDMNKLQIKIISTKHKEDTPTVYLDGMKVEVLYDTPFMHEHPDFARDTILKDETAGGIRILTIINNETNLQEIWYMYLEDATTTDESATSTEAVASTTIQVSTSTIIIPESDATSTVATTTAASSTPRIKPVIPKNIWLKFEGERREGISGETFAREIRKTDEEKNKSEEEKKNELPDFAIDIIKRVKGVFLNAVIVQLEKDNKEELWVYDLEKDTQEKIDVGTSTSLSASSPLGVKDGYVFWLSEDKGQVFAYNIETKEIKVEPVPAYDAANGERGEVIFLGIPWKVIIGAGEFSFFSEATGEVFSDDNGSIAEALRQKLKLDAVLSKEELSNLNLQVEVTADSQ